MSIRISECQFALSKASTSGPHSIGNLNLIDS